MIYAVWAGLPFVLTTPISAPAGFTNAGSVDEDVMRVVVHKTREIAKIMD
jgi:hypothetical protein